MKNVNAKVAHIESLNNTVYKVELELEGTTFIAGQYLMIALPSGEKVPYSIGSAPHELPSLTLYILVTEETSLAAKVMNHLQSQDTVSVAIPGGDANINAIPSDTTAPLLLIAGGTGFAQMKSIYDDLIHKNHEGPVYFYWGLRTSADTFIMDWIGTHQAPDNFHVHVVLNEGDQNWQGRTGWLYSAILEDHLDLTHSHAFISGSVGMVYGTLDQLEARGIQERNCHSDVFAYAPRPSK
ncbi:NAD(P)H-flavin reductase [Marinomonas piezotolerans]|uniref:NAD(P)H-flavin reductase n=1 Tax=Marinomonas piezotolerans TaxID=2213058 RepID=A0A370U8K3_9GAMM|nr:NAD(P)H-flavin reductase [Marinomonas piezotolerans]RDL44104.1 NAD(P)H-flavin reductase [Marinomonas piezotolerans]